MLKWTSLTALLIVVLSAHLASAATPDNAKAEPPKLESTPADKAKATENRKKPLQRCDELADKAQQDCLQKARQRIVEARAKREASAKGGAAREQQATGKASAAKDTPPK